MNENKLLDDLKSDFGDYYIAPKLKHDFVNDLNGFTSGYYYYTPDDNRGLIYQGRFDFIGTSRQSQEFRTGQEILYPKICLFTGVFISTKIAYMKDNDNHWLSTTLGGAIANPLIHTSLYDQIVYNPNYGPETRKLLDRQNESVAANKTKYFIF